MYDVYTISILISIATFILTTHITPGPTNIILLSSVLNFGYKRSLPFMIANIISYPVLMSFTALGIGMFILKHPMIMLILKIVGIIYLCYMAWKIATSTSSYNTDNTIPNKPFTFLQGLIYPWLNPKAWVIAAGAISAYTNAQTSIYPQIFLIAFIFFLVAFPSVFIWLIFGNKLKKVLKNDSLQKKFNYSMAFLLMLSVLPILRELLYKYIIL